MARLVAAKCPNCGANVRIDPAHEYATCSYCHTSSFVQTKQRPATAEIRRHHPAVIDIASAHGVVMTVMTIGIALSVLAVFAVVAFRSIARHTTSPPTQVARTTTEPGTEPRSATPAIVADPIAVAPATAAQAALGDTSARARSAEVKSPSTDRPKATLPAQTSRVSAGTPTVSGRLEVKMIREVVQARYGAFRACHTAALARTPGITGTVRARFVIGRDGSVANVNDGGSDLVDPAMKSCVLGAFRGVSFPKPEGGIVTVVYPLVFRVEAARG